MYLAVVPNRDSPPAILLRESIREGKKVRTRTVANLSFLSMPQVEAMRRVLRGDVLVSPGDLFDKLRDQAHGAVDAVRWVMSKLRFDALLDKESSRERNLIIAVVVARIVAANSKLGTTRWLATTTLPEDLGIEDATEDEIYEAMDWLFERQDAIEEQLAARHLAAGGLVLYDLSSSYFEGTTCPLAALGHSRDGKKGKLQVNYGLLTDSRGCPVAVSVFKGNTGDPTTLLPQVDKVRGKFTMERFASSPRVALCRWACSTRRIYSRSSIRTSGRASRGLQESRTGQASRSQTREPSQCNNQGPRGHSEDGLAWPNHGQSRDRRAHRKIDQQV